MKKNTYRKCVPINELEAYMRAWCDRKPGCVTVNVIGKSGEYDIYDAVFTDSSVDDDDKQIALIIAQHSGMEISGMTTALSLGNFLASDSKEAEEILKKTIVVIIPCPNPFSYAKQSSEYQFKNEFGVDEYIQFNYEGAKPGGKNPAAVAIQSVIDKYKPELILDLHGVWAARQLVKESFGESAFAANRPYNMSFMKRVQAAGTASGVGHADLDEMGTLLQTDMGCKDPVINAHFFPTASDRGNVAPTYAYLHYHTIGGSFEIAWEKGGLARIIEALKIGCSVWPGEEYPGYPVMNPISPCGYDTIRVNGRNAKERRESRIELWQNRHRISLGIGHPEMPGINTMIVSLSPKMTKELTYHYMPMTELAERMKALENVDADKIYELVDEEYESFASIDAKEGDDIVLKHGMTLRFEIPFPDAKIKSVTYNGIVKNEDEIDGYTIVENENWVYVDLHVPACKVAPFAVAIVKYDSTTPEDGIIEF